jgi:hypothetical protein
VIGKKHAPAHLGKIWDHAYIQSVGALASVNLNNLETIT